MWGKYDCKNMIFILMFMFVKNNNWTTTMDHHVKSFVLSWSTSLGQKTAIQTLYSVLGVTWCNSLPIFLLLRIKYQPGYVVSLWYYDVCSSLTAASEYVFLSLLFFYQMSDQKNHSSPAWQNITQQLQRCQVCKTCNEASQNLPEEAQEEFH